MSTLRVPSTLRWTSAVALCLVVLVQTAFAQSAASTTADSPPPTSKKAAEYANKTLAFDSKKIPEVGKPPEKLINLRNTWTDEWVAIDPSAYFAELGNKKPRIKPGLLAQKIPPSRLNEFMRCHFTNEATDMAPRLTVFVLAAATHFGSPVVEIVSTFRHPKYNLMLRKKGHEVASDSQHTHGHAVDFRLRGVDVKALSKWAKGKAWGGVGTYLRSKFIHMDVGPVRTWNGE